MTCRTRIVAIIATLCAIIGVQGIALAAEDGEAALVARIGEVDVVTEVEFERELGMLRQQQMMQARMSGRTEPIIISAQQKGSILDRIIDTKLIHQRAVAEGFKATDADVDAQIEAAKARLPEGMTMEQFLEQRGLTVEELKELSRQRLTLQGYGKAQTESIIVDDAALKATYDQAKEAGALDRADVSHILIRVEGADPNTWEEKKKDIDGAYERIQAGEAFAEVAKEVTEDPGSKESGGAYPDTPRGQMVPEFDQRAFETPVGEVTEPFRTQFGWHILTVTDRRTEDFDSMSDKLRAQAQQQQMGELIQKVIEEGREANKVEVLVEFEDDTPAPAAPPAPTPDSVVIQ